MRERPIRFDLPAGGTAGVQDEGRNGTTLPMDTERVLDPELTTVLVRTLTTMFTEWDLDEPALDALHVVEALASNLRVGLPRMESSLDWPQYRSYLVALEAVMPALWVALDEFLDEGDPERDRLVGEFQDEVHRHRGSVPVAVQFWCDGPLTDAHPDHAGMVHNTLRRALDDAFDAMVTAEDLADLERFGAL